ncbi:MAG TPA: hypothetical protein DEA59_12825, partial [Microbacterium sp.]|nr:hypothetical protein [Microbacterium sp.]
GTRVDRDRPTRQAVWPGQDAPEPVEETVIADRDADFVAFVNVDLARRRDAEEAYYASLIAHATDGDGFGEQTGRSGSEAE